MMVHDILMILFTIIVSALLTAFFIPQIQIVSFKKRLFDYADKRKVHLGFVSRLGGVAFMPSIVMTLALVEGICETFGFTALGAANEIPYIAFGLCAMMLLYLEGVMDDLIGLSYRHKLLIQTITALLVVASGICFHGLNGLLGIYGMPLYVGIPFTVLIIVFLINAINLIDGIDGLASGLAIVATFFFGLIFMMLGMQASALLSFATLGTLCPFFYYNVFGSVKSKRKIFMGDTGSQSIGLILAFLAIRLATWKDHGHPLLNGSVLLVAFSMLIVPAFDVIRVVLHRIRCHTSPFKPDKNHIHHKLLKLGLSPHKVMITIVLVSIGFVVLNFLLLPVVNDNIILLIDIAVYTGGNIWLTRVIDRQQGKADAEGRSAQQ